ISDQKKFKTSLAIVALRKQIKLPTYVGPDRQKIYHQIQIIRDKKAFDKFYLENMTQLTTTMITRSEDFLDKNKEGTVREFVSKNTGKYKDYVKKLSQMQEYMDKVDPQISTAN
ncbi:MAG TPA: hypothetical protein VI583_08070, partial [Cyclobacteriaceae bacterium]|nr:hypothetical protein [Cyclobacteriaceae bacterium]